MPTVTKKSLIKFELLKNKIKDIPATVGGINIGNWIKLVSDFKNLFLLLDSKKARGVPSNKVINNEIIDVVKVNLSDSIMIWLLTVSNWALTPL